jgi:hypothetical protein
MTLITQLEVYGQFASGDCGRLRWQAAHFYRFLELDRKRDSVSAVCFFDFECWGSGISHTKATVRRL